MRKFLVILASFALVGLSTRAVAYTYCHPDYGCTNVTVTNQTNLENTVVVQPAPVNVTVNPTPVINNVTVPEGKPSNVVVDTDVTVPQSATAQAANPASITMRGMRPLPNAPDLQFAPLPEVFREDGGTVPKDEEVPFYGPKNPGWNFVTVSEMLLYGRLIYVKDAKALLGSDSPLWEKVFDGEFSINQVLVVTAPVQNVVRRGHIIMQSKKGCTSYDLLYYMVLRTALTGFDVLHLTAQGLERVAKTRGVGGSTGAGGSMLSPGESSGLTSSLMASIVGGESKTIDLVWLRGIKLATRN